MTAVWIGIAVAVAGVLAWRLRLASALVDRILREERDAARTEAGAADNSESEVVDEHDR